MGHLAVLVPLCCNFLKDMNENILSEHRKKKEVQTSGSKQKMRQTDGKNIVDRRELSNGKISIENKNKNVKVPEILTYANVLKNTNYEEKMKPIPLGLG